MVSVKNLVAPVTVVARINTSLKCSLPPLRYGDRGYTLCVIKKNNDAIMLQDVQPEQCFELECDAPVACVLVTPSEDISLRSSKVVMRTENEKEDIEFLPCDLQRGVFEPVKVITADPLAIVADKKQYAALKKSVLNDTLLVVAGGTSVLAFGQHHEATAFVVGGSLGTAFLLQLIQQVDHIERRELQAVLGAVRFLSSVGAIGFLEYIFANEIREQPALLVYALLGFMCFRVGLIRAH